MKEHVGRCLSKQEIPDLLVISVMNMYEGAKTKVREDSLLSEGFEIKVGICVINFFFSVVLNFVTELAIKSALSELFYADDLVLVSETIVRLWYRKM